LPELAPFVGHTVDITIDDQPEPGRPNFTVIPGTGDWEAFEKAAEALSANYDYDAIARQDAIDIRDAEERMK